MSVVFDLSRLVQVHKPVLHGLLLALGLKLSYYLLALGGELLLIYRRLLQQLEQVSTSIAALGDLDHFAEPTLFQAEGRTDHCVSTA